MHSKVCGGQAHTSANAETFGFEGDFLWEQLIVQTKASDFTHSTSPQLQQRRVGVLGRIPSSVR
jgi:hypothetical protein